ncbi:MAG: imidazole glycerol phosphate synthase subunit HisH [Syntrophales bacterium]|nr:imidazole glycerol phosphate synthase subunit HisH [Syntrophales bacterium]
MIAIVDYKAGNLTSVARALHCLNQTYCITSDPEILQKASHIIFPGVGAAGEAMLYLRHSGLDLQICNLVAVGKPFLGICLGTQVIFQYSEENRTHCLGIVPGSVRLFPKNLQQGGSTLKIPHMGWNEVSFMKHHPVFKGIDKGAAFYFVHSYYPTPEDPAWILGLTDYGQSFCSIVAHKNLVAVQFHPEKSGKPGLKILENFCRWGGRDVE